MQKITRNSPVIAAAVVGILGASQLRAATWAHVGSDWNTGANWSTTAVPNGTEAVAFQPLVSPAPMVQTSNLSSSLTATVFHMDTVIPSGAVGGGWTFTASPDAALTLTGTGSTINGGTTAFRSYANVAGSSGNINTVSIPLILAPSSGTNQTFGGANSNQMTQVNITGDISEGVTGVNLDIAAGGGNNAATFHLSGNNSFTGDFRASARVSVSSIGNKGESSAVGAGNRIVLGHSLTTGVNLAYTGGAKTTDRDFHFGVANANSREFRHYGTGHLKFTGSVTGESRNYDVTFRISDASGILEYTDGFENYGSSLTTLTVRNSAGTFILSGASAFGDADDADSGDLVVGLNAANAGGTVLINGSLAAAGNVEVRYGTLGGTGDGITTGLIAGQVRVGTGVSGGGNYEAKLAPGNSIGTLTAGSVIFGGDGVLAIEVADVGAGTSDGSVDLLNVIGALNITSARVDFSESGTLNDNVFIFATYGTLTGAAFNSVVDLPTDYVIDYNYNNTNSIALVNVNIPEPASLGVLAMAAMTALRRRRAR